MEKRNLLYIYYLLIMESVVLISLTLALVDVNNYKFHWLYIIMAIIPPVIAFQINLKRHYKKQK